jgi:hypothetical protein
MMRCARPMLLLWLLGGCTQLPPKPRDAIKFQHAPHLRAGTQCTRCHVIGSGPMTKKTAADVVAASSAPGRSMLPSEALCQQCHERKKTPCGLCHQHPEAARSYGDKKHGTSFDHVAHAERKVTSCVSCHGIGVSDETVATFTPRLPPMRVCTSSCHAQDLPALRCGLCHQDLHRYARADLRLVRHPPGFLHQHGARARASDQLCSQCHEPTFCSDCHTASPGLSAELLAPTDVTREFIHAADFRARHPAEARLDQATCLRCHGPSFCDGCHSESGIGGSVGKQSPHPPGWLDPLSPRGHARAARQNILTCAGCHESDAERTCVPCHRVGSIAGNPHPAGFGAGIDASQRGVCRVCHAK